MSRSTFRRKGKPLPPKISCKVHPNIEAADPKKRLCKNCLALSEHGQKRAAQAAAATARR